MKKEKVGGPGRDRTDDLFHAMEARSQLRHRPTRGRNNLPILADASGLVKPARNHTQSPTAASMSVVAATTGSTATPSRKLTVRPLIAGTRSPGTIMPTRFSGSAAD